MSKIIMLTRLELREFEVFGNSGWLYKDVFEIRFYNKVNLNHDYTYEFKNLYVNVFIENERFYLSIEKDGLASNKYKVID